GEPLTCERIKAEVDRVFSEHATAVDEIIVSHGAQSAIGHDAGSGAILPGETVVADLFPFDKATGCYADMTRTFVVGEPTEEAREWHQLSLGHGVGLDVHEEPGLGRNGRALVAGDVLAVEPGLYRQGVGGCRLEDLV